MRTVAGGQWPGVRYAVAVCALSVLGGQLLAWTPPVRPLASLVFTGGDTDNVNCGSASSLDNMTAFTWYAWVYQTASVTSGARGVVMKNNGGLLTGKEFFIGATNRTRITVQRATTNASLTGADNSFVAALNTWTFVAATYDESGGPRGWRGDLTSPVAEITYNGTPAVGSGATSTDASGNLYVGDRCPSGTCSNDSFPGHIALVAVYNRRFTQAELRVHQFRPFCQSPDCKLFVQLGWAGTGTQPDLSGKGNNCSVTGAVVASHVPTAR